MFSQLKLLRKVSLLAAAPLVALAVGCAPGVSSEEVSTPVATTTQKQIQVSGTATATFGPTPTRTPVPSYSPVVPVAPVVTQAPVRAACEPASADYVEQVNAHLSDGQTLANAYVVDGPEYTYVGGDIMAGEVKASSADVWLAQDGYVFWALTLSAREASDLADGRTWASAGDQYGTAVQECVTG